MQQDENSYQPHRRWLGPLQDRRVEEGEANGEFEQNLQLDSLREARLQWEELHCRKTSGNDGWEPVTNEYLPLDGILTSNESIATDESLLALTLTAAGIDFCSDNEDYPFQHFQFFSGDSQQQESNVFENNSSPAGWAVNCCDSLQQLDNQFYQMVSTPVPSELPSAAPTHPRCYEPVPGVQEIDFFPFAVVQIFVSGVAAFFSLATILAMTLPLLKTRRRKKASTYNLYLVFLAVPDLIYNLFLVFLFTTYEEWICIRIPGKFPWIDHPYDLALFATCAAANLYMNAIIALEILKLLRNSKRRKRSKAPSLKKACMQAFCTYSVGAAIFALDYNADRIREDLNTLPKWVIPSLYFILDIGIPISILLWVCFCIWFEKLIGDVRTKAGKRLSILIKYFTRIIVVYICIWLPAAVFYLSQFFERSTEGLYYYIACFLYGLAAWANFGLSLTKPDVRKNVVDLFTGKAFLPDPKKPDESGMKFSGSERFRNTGSADKQELRENKPTTTSTEEDTAAVAMDVEQGLPARKEKASIQIVLDDDNKQSSTESSDANVFDFEGKDAPVERTEDEIQQIQHKRSRGAFSMLGRRMYSSRKSIEVGRRSSVSGPLNHSDSKVKNLRSSLMRSFSEMGPSSEPFGFHSNRFDSNRLDTSEQFHCPSGRTIDGSDVPGDRESQMTPDRESQITLPSAFRSNKIGTSSTGTVSFFMLDRTSDNRSVRESNNQSNMDASTGRASRLSTFSSPKEQKDWIRGIKKNIRDLKFLLKKENISQEQKTVLRQSIFLKTKALQSIKSVTIPQSGVDVSNRSELTESEASPYVFDEDMGEFSDDDDDNGDINSTDKASSRYSKTRWLTELRKNIQDLNLRLVEEDLTEEERLLISRAIESQTLTLSSIEGIDEDANENLFDTICNDASNRGKTGSSSKKLSSLDFIAE